MTRLITVFDEEATGLLKPETRIIEFSARIFDLDTEEEKKNFTWRFDPQRSIEAKAQAVHGITLDDLKGKPTIEKYIDDITKIFKQSYLVVGHNIEAYDIPLLGVEYARFNKELPEFKVFDTMVHGTFATDLGKSPTLEELCWCLDVDYNPAEAHKADYDTLKNSEAFFTGVRRGWFNIEDLT